MKFDLFHELALPPQSDRTESDACRDFLAEIELADRLGYRCAWLVEHHFMPGYSHCSKPELLLAAASQRTRRIRLGHAVIPLPLHHPVHVAERIATLDVLTGGRIEVGVGRGFSPLEYRTFGVPMEASRELTEEGLAILRASFRAAPVSHDGRHYRVEALEIVPHVVQRPHPPLWTAAVSPETYEWAAEHQLGVLAGPFKPWFMVKHDIARFRNAWRAPEPPRCGMTVGVLCLADRARARELARPAFSWFYRELYKAVLPVLERAYPGYEHVHELGRFRHLVRLGVDFGLADAFGMTVVGNPRECIDRLGKYRDGGVTHLLCAFGAGAVDHAIVEESMACFAAEVMPAFADTPAPARATSTPT
jgi:alkanesulfonate monooxygenase SsuD/methylene tetrahydromethanopterin reductase-like flavin-dependent oxidoreductase (luciferase family)